MSREESMKYIKDKGYQVPRKSGCWICPFAKPKELIELKKNYPEFYKKRIFLESDMDICFKQKNNNQLLSFM